MISESESLLPTAISIVGASAGTGKTSRLAGEFVKAVLGESENCRKTLDPTEIIVCTFTNKAADELQSRIRQKLLEKGKTEEAQLVLASYVGTVNSVCGRILKDYAFEAGLSPKQEVIPEHMQANLFAIASANVIDAYAQGIEPIARRLSFLEPPRNAKYKKSSSWHSHVRQICTLARANDLDAESLRQSARRSLQGLKNYLPEAEQAIPAEELDSLLCCQLEIVVNEIEDKNKSLSLVDEKALQTLRHCLTQARNFGMNWRDWVSIKTLSVGAANKKILENLYAAANVLHMHPRLHQDLEDYLTRIFECSIDCLESYQAYKAVHGLVDFVDQEYLALKLLDIPAVKESLASRIELVFIDEFQDTSPIQLALFLKLAGIARSSVWVGDVKQAIYGFRGSDPQLMQESADYFTRMPPLEKSYRARKALVDFSNDIFSEVFPAFGIERTQVEIKASGNRKEAELNALELWRCQGEELEGCFQSLAFAIKDFLEKNSTKEIDDPEKSGEKRLLRGSDIAVLCRKNAHAARLAGQLSKLGLKVARMQEGLLETPEALLAVAGLRYLIDASDREALAMMIHLLHDYGASDQSSWLNQWLVAAKDPESLLESRADFELARKRLPECSVSEALNLALASVNIFEIIKGWGNIAGRLSNLDSLRGMVIDYEQTASIASMPSSCAGFLSYLIELEGSMQAASNDPEAVQLFTYHAAKGLEWPVVILCDLDAEARASVAKDLCRLSIESDGKFLVKDPLKNRWIRFWPWPFGFVEKDGLLEQNALASPEMAATSRRVLAENLRLLYVGITRARDCLVLAPYTGRQSNQNQDGLQWLHELKGESGPLFKFPLEEGQGIIKVGQAEHRILSKNFSYKEIEADSKSSATFLSYFPAGAGQKSKMEKEFRPYFLRASSLPDSVWTTEASVKKVYETGAGITYKCSKNEMNLLGECIHAFIAAAELEENYDARVSMARTLIQNFRIEGKLDPESLLLIKERLDTFINEKFGKHSAYYESPFSARISDQRMKGALDLLVETEDAFYIIDHKAISNESEQNLSKALDYAGQLFAYKQAIELASIKPVKGLFLHLPLDGRILELS